ncbi:MAG TPA: diguanylate cyclase [Fluviicoccus sp.]|nr:diguanylate cyclase [Fluviicoccus sp.]
MHNVVIRPALVFLRFLLCLAGLLAPQALLAAVPANIDSATAALPLAASLDTRLTPLDAGLPAMLQDNSGWQPNSRRLNSFGYAADRALWLRFRLDRQEAAAPLFVRYDYPNTDYLDLWYVRDGRVLAHYQGGDRRPFQTRPVDQRNYLFPVPAVAGPVDAYLRVESQGPLEAPLALVNAHQADRDEQEMMLWIGLYFGIIAIMVLYNAFILLIVRQTAYLYYVLYVLSCAALQFVLFGLGFRYLWPTSVTLNNTLTMTLPALTLATAIAFVFSFIDLKRHGARWEQWIAKGIFAACAALLAAGLTLPYHVAFTGTKVLTFACVLTGFYIGVKYWLKGVKSARIFALAWFSYLVFILIYLLELSGSLPSNLFTRNALAIGATLELALLSIAFADKMNEEKDKRLTAQSELLQIQMQTNADLDRKVRERTEALEEANRRLQMVSITDGLTGLKNRRFFDESSHAEYQRAYREKTCLSFLMIDIDFFKRINDTYGHPFGDLCLQKAAGIIMSAIKRPPDLAARYGGEEFIVMLPNTDPEGAMTVARLIHRTFAETVVSDGQREVTLTVSIGVAGEIPQERDGREALLKLADDRLYRAKESGRNRVEWLDGGAAAAV